MEQSRKNVPVQIGNDSDWVSVTVGSNFSLAIKSDGSLWSWGQNWYGQLCNGSFEYGFTPMQVGNSTDWKAISAGDIHALAVKNDGTLWAWGANEIVRGNGWDYYQITPAQVGTDTDWSSVSAGRLHSAAIKTNGTLWSWGNNWQGVLGDGTNVDSEVPLQVGYAADWKSVSAGGEFTLAIRGNGTLWGWGTNYSGQLGDGSYVPQFVPVQIRTDTDWKEVAAGNSHSVALKADGAVWAWGQNMFNQIRSDASYYTSHAVLIGNNINAKAIAAGHFHSLVIGSDRIVEGPVLAPIGYKQVNEREQLTFTATVIKTNNSSAALTFSLEGTVPAGAAIKASTGEFTWTPSEEQGGASYTFKVKVFDGASSDEKELTIEVLEVNTVPVVTSVPVTTAIVGQTYTYQLTATDADLPTNTLTYTGIQIPSWLNFDPATKQLSGVPGIQDVNEYRVVMWVSDRDLMTEHVFTLTVQEAAAKEDKKNPKHLVKVFPNPTTGIVLIRMEGLPQDKELTATFRTLNGNKIFSTRGTLQQINEKVNIALTSSKDGIYMLKLTFDKGVANVKIIKE